MLHRLKVSGKVLPKPVIRPLKVRVPIVSNFHRPVIKSTIMVKLSQPIHAPNVKIYNNPPRAIQKPFKQPQQVPQPPRPRTHVPTIVVKAPPKAPPRPLGRNVPPTTQQKMSDLRKKAQERGKVVVHGLNQPNAFTGYYHKITAAKNSGAGRVLIILAAGPSINEINLVPIRGHAIVDFMCINQPHQAVWPTKYWAFCDHTQYRRNENTWNNYNTGIIWNSPNVRARKANQIVVNVLHGKGFSQDITRGYHIGRSSTYAGMQIANFMGYRKVYIFGLDMGAVNGALHYYGQNPDVTNQNRMARFEAEAENYMWAAQNLPKEVREKFYICSTHNKWPFVEFFNRMDHTTAVSDILQYANSLVKPEQK